MTRLRSGCLIVCAIVIAVPSSFGADKRPANRTVKNFAALTPAQAGHDFAVQGEYVGQIQGESGKETFGVQIVALGNGKFRAVAYRGGLPGDGWNGIDKIEAPGETVGGKTVFKGKKGRGIVENGLLRVQSDGGEEIARFKKVIRKSPTLGKKPPKGAVVLFDGTSGKEFIGARLTQGGLMKEGVTSRRKFQSYSLHLEFLLSFMPNARSQGRSNSGCYQQGRYEVQILDSFALEGKDNECGAIYGIRAPDTNMCFPPLSWQTYDIDFTAARFDDSGKKTADARLTVRHNGVLIQHHVAVPRTTRAAPVQTEGPQPGPIYIQNHHNPVRFRNIWLVEHKSAPKRKNGYFSLFDGKTLKGWHKNPKRIGHGTGGHWFVENGEIVGEQDPPGSGNGGILLTDRKFRNFELLIDMKPSWGVCSGLFLRSNNRGKCFQMMVDYHDRGNVGHIYGEGLGGFNNRLFSIFGVYDKQKRLLRLTTKPNPEKPPKAYSISGADWVKVWKLNDWNRARVRVVGNPPTITTWINGTKISEFDGNTFPQKRYHKNEVAKILGPEGRIAVQVHGGKTWPKGGQCRWKNIKIKLLSP